MKKLLAAVLAASVSFSVFGYDIFSYVSINGNAKSYTCTEYSVATKFGDYFRTPVGKVVHVLDGGGKDIESAEYTPRDVLINKIKYVYDSKGNITTKTGYNSSDEVIWRTASSFKNGEKHDESQFGKDNSLKAKTIYGYSEGLLVDETDYDGSGALVWKIVYKYNENKKLLSEAHYFADGSLSEECIYSYLPSGAIETITTNSVIEGRNQEVFRYAANGQLTEITTYNAEGKVTKRIIVKYDGQGNVSKISEYNIAEKFGTTVNELVSMFDYTYSY